MVLSAIFYCCYCSGLFQLLEQRRTGCWVNNDYMGIAGYSDDNLLMAPSLDALQDMLATCEEYAVSHNLKFSTDPIPRKSKTRCLAFQRKARTPDRRMKLCDNFLPWENSGKHIGNKIITDNDITRQDVKEKRAKYIGKNNEIIQEFYFAHPKTKVRINSIWNSHFSGSVLWNLFSPESEQLYGTYNQSVKIMFGLPRSAHRFFIEPLTGTAHLKKVLIRRFLSFVDSIKNSKKIALKNLFKVVKNDCRSVTGRNLNMIRNLVGKDSVENLVPMDSDSIKYCEIKAEDRWRLSAWFRN